MNFRLFALIFVVIIATSCAQQRGTHMEATPAEASPTVAAVAPADTPSEEAPATTEVTPKERPFLWIVERDVPVYLYGTIHLPDERVKNLPPVVEQAILDSDELYTEIPMDVFTIARAAFSMMAPAGERLSNVLPQDLYNRADLILKKYDQSITAYDAFKIWALMSILPQLDYIAKGQTEALDQKIYQFAVKNGKRVGGIETVTEQLSVFDSTTRDDLIHLLRATIDQMEETMNSSEPSPTEQLLRAYLTGDLDAVVAYVEEEQDPDDEVTARFMKKLLEDRNHKMAERIDQRLRENPDTGYFFAIGLLHYPLEEGLLELFEEMGYTITRYEPGTELPTRRNAAERTAAAHYEG